MELRKKVFKIFADREKEEAYINYMNKQGWKLISVNIVFYTFEHAEPNKYKTVFYFEERSNLPSFIRTVTECGCEIAHQAGVGKYILLYINVPVSSETAEFLSDNQSKLDFKKRLLVSNRREAVLLFVEFLFMTALLLFGLFSSGFSEIDTGSLLMMVGLSVCLIITGSFSAYYTRLCRRVKKDIRKLSAEMKLFE